MSLETTLNATGILAVAAPYTGIAESFITYHMVNEEDTTFADGDAQAGERMYSVDYFSKVDWRMAVATIKAALKAPGTASKHRVGNLASKPIQGYTTFRFSSSRIRDMGRIETEGFDKVISELEILWRAIW